MALNSSMASRLNCCGGFMSSTLLAHHCMTKGGYLAKFGKSGFWRCPNLKSWRSCFLAVWHEIAAWTYKTYFIVVWSTFVAIISNASKSKWLVGLKLFCGGILNTLRTFELIVTTTVPPSISESSGRNFKRIHNNFTSFIALACLGFSCSAMISSDNMSEWNLIKYSWKLCGVPAGSRNWKHCETSNVSDSNVGNPEAIIGYENVPPESEFTEIKPLEKFSPATAERWSSLDNSSVCWMTSTSLVPFTRIRANAEISETGRFSGSFCHASMAEMIPTANSMKTPPITNHSPQIFMILHHLKSFMFFGSLCSEYCSIKSPQRTTKAPITASTTYPKIDPVVILLYAILAFVALILISACVVSVWHFRKYG